jgi:hypothetical protein
MTKRSDISSAPPASRRPSILREPRQDSPAARPRLRPWAGRKDEMGAGRHLVLHADQIDCPCHDLHQASAEPCDHEQDVQTLVQLHPNSQSETIVSRLHERVDKPADATRMRFTRFSKPTSMP